MKKVILGAVFAASLGLFNSVHAVPMGFNVDVQLNAPINLPVNGIVIPWDGIDGMLFGDAAPDGAPGTLDCFLGGPCEVTSAMFTYTNAGATAAELDLVLDNASNTFGQFVGTLSNGFGSIPVAALVSGFAYDVFNPSCSGDADKLCLDGFLRLLLDNTADGATADDIAFLQINFSAAAPGQASQIPSVVSFMQDLCTDCGTIDIDPKPAPEPSTVLLLGLGLLGIGYAKRKAA